MRTKYLTHWMMACTLGLGLGACALDDAPVKDMPLDDTAVDNTPADIAPMVDNATPSATTSPRASADNPDGGSGGGKPDGGGGGDKPDGGGGGGKPDGGGGKIPPYRRGFDRLEPR